jgi:hypothetical protein
MSLFSLLTQDELICYNCGVSGRGANLRPTPDAVSSLGFCIAELRVLKDF